MKNKFKIFSFLLIVLFTFSCSEEEMTDLEELEKEISADLTIEDEILKLVNQHREDQGLDPLIKNETATELSVDHTKYMISINKINHDDFNERSKVLQQKEKAVRTGENVAVGQPTAKAVVKAWLDSPGHRKNIEGNFSHSGIAAIKNDQGRFYYTQLFFKK